jgi:hypothetical protein
VKVDPETPGLSTDQKMRARFGYASPTRVLSVMSRLHRPKYHPQQAEMLYPGETQVPPIGVISAKRLQEFQLNMGDPYQRFLSDYPSYTVDETETAKNSNRVDLNIHNDEIEGAINNSSNSKKSSGSILDLIIMPFKILWDILEALGEAADTMGAPSNAGQIQNSNYYSGTTYKCINGHQISSVTIPSKCPFCGAGMF